MIESLFGYTLQNSTKNDEAKSKSPSPSKHVLEPKRLQNITILSKALNVTADQVCGALVQGTEFHILKGLFDFVLSKCIVFIDSRRTHANTNKDNIPITFF